MNLENPGPSQLPNTFCAPWATNIAANVKRSGNVIHKGEVAMILRNI